MDTTSNEPYIPSLVDIPQSSLCSHDCPSPTDLRFLRLKKFGLAPLPISHGSTENPIILIREFGTAGISYRIATRRAVNYIELLDHIYALFQKTTEEYTAHLHFEDYECEGRAAASEWDAGGYFGKEFVSKGRLTLYAHFEKIKKADHGSGRKDSERTASEPLHVKTKSSGPQHLSIFKSNEYHTPISQPLSTLESPVPSIQPPRSISRTFDPSSFSGSSSSITTVDDTFNRFIIEDGIVVGRAKGYRCRDPDIRPLVRGMLNSVGALTFFMPAKYSTVDKKGDIGIAHRDVDYLPQFEKYPFGEKRFKVIKEAINMKKTYQMQ